MSRYIFFRIDYTDSFPSSKAGCIAAVEYHIADCIDGRYYRSSDNVEITSYLVGPSYGHYYSQVPWSRDLEDRLSSMVSNLSSMRGDLLSLAESFPVSTILQLNDGVLYAKSGLHGYHVLNMRYFERKSNFSYPALPSQLVQRVYPYTILCDFR